MRIRFRGPLKKLFDQEHLSPRTRQSLYFLTVGGIMGSLCCTVCGSGTSALTSLASFLGAGDFVYGVLTAIPMLAALLQIPFSIIVSRAPRRHPFMLTYSLIGRALWIVIGLVPFFLQGAENWIQLWTIILLVGLSSALQSFINVCWMPWMADVAPIHMRGRWMSIKDSISNVATALFGLVVGWLLDAMPNMVGYGIIFGISGIFGVIDMLTYIGVEDVRSAPPSQIKVTSVLKKLLGDKRFLWFMIFWTGWCFTANMSGMYYTRYSVNEMGLTYTQITIFATIVACVTTTVFMPFWGRQMDRYGYKPVMWVSALVGSLTPLIYLFSSPANVWPTFIYNFLGAMFWCASNLACTNMQLGYAPDVERASYVAIFSCVTSIAGGFLGVLSGGALLEMLDGMGFGADRYLIMFALSSILRLVVVLLLLPKMENNREYTVRDMLARKL